MNRRLALFMAILWIAGFAQAKDLRWKDLPRYLNKTRIGVVDGSGVRHHGAFIAIRGDAIVIDEQGAVEIPRSSVLWIVRHKSRDDYFEKLEPVAYLFAPGPTMILRAPVAIAIFAVGLPICALLNLIDRRPSWEERIRLLPDPK